MRASPCLRLELSDDERVALLLEDYAFFVQDPELFCRRLATLTELRGKAVVERWQALVLGGELETVVRELLKTHYDPGYATSTRRNFALFGQALECELPDRSEASMARLARELVASPG